MRVSINGPLPLPCKTLPVPQPTTAPIKIHASKYIHSSLYRNLLTASAPVANLCLLSKDTFRYPKRVGEFTRPRVKKVVPHRTSSSRTTRGPLFRGGPQ